MQQLLDHIVSCTTGPVAKKITDDLKINVEMNLNIDGTIAATPSIIVSCGTEIEHREFRRIIFRSLNKCSPYDFLPSEK